MTKKNVKTQPTGGGLEARQLPLDQLTAFKNHPFELYDENRLSDMAESIKVNGVMQPIIVRPAKDGGAEGNGGYEILSGHNRVEAAKKAGLTAIPAVVREDLANDDEKAQLVVMLTNIQQRGFSDLSYSQRAKAIRLTYDSLKRQGQRTDLLDEADILMEDKRLFSANLKRLTPKDAVAAQFGLTPNNIAYYLRLQKLHKNLLARLENGEFELTVAEKLSYLPEKEQKTLDGQIKKLKVKVTIGKAKALVNASHKEPLTAETINEVFAKTTARKSNHRLDADVMESYFAEKTPEEIDDILKEALDAYFQKGA